MPKLRPEQVQAYLEENHRSVESLLAAFQTTDDQTFLQEAIEKYPTDPRLDYVAWFRSQSPEERRQWLDTFKQSAPDNAFANYLSARDYFKSGKNDQAVQELLVAATKPIQDYSLDFVQNGEEAYRAGGFWRTGGNPVGVEQVRSTVMISFGSRHFIVESPLE